jgi:hypothetical protein
MSDGKKLSGFTGAVGSVGSVSATTAVVLGRRGLVFMGGGGIAGGIGSSSGAGAGATAGPGGGGGGVGATPGPGTGMGAGAVWASVGAASAGTVMRTAKKATKTRGRTGFIDIRLFLLEKARTVP